MTEPDPDRVRRCARLVLSLIAEIQAEPDEPARAILTAAAISTISEALGSGLEAWGERTKDDP